MGGGRPLRSYLQDLVFWASEQGHWLVADSSAVLSFGSVAEDEGRQQERARVYNWLGQACCLEFTVSY